MFQTRLYWFLSWYFFSSTISHFHDELPLSIEVSRSFGTLSIRCVFVLLEPQSDKIPNNKTEQYTFSKSLNKWQQITHLTQRSQNKSWILKSLNFYSYISNCGHCRITTCKIPIKFCYSVTKALSNIYIAQTQQQRVCLVTDKKLFKRLTNYRTLCPAIVIYFHQRHFHSLKDLRMFLIGCLSTWRGSTKIPIIVVTHFRYFSVQSLTDPFFLLMILKNRIFVPSVH